MVKKKLVFGVLHYSTSPVIGGVESVVDAQIRLLCENGHEVYSFSGNASPALHEKHRHFHFPLLAVPTEHPHPAPEEFSSIFEQIAGLTEVLLVHNLFTMPFHPSLTQALLHFVEQAPAHLSIVNWFHDIAILNPHYQVPESPPFDIFHAPPASFFSKVHPVTISAHRAREWEQRFHQSPHIIPNPIDISHILQIPPELHRYLETHQIYQRDLIAFHPARLVSRKNFEAALHIVAGLRDLGYSVAYLLTASPDPHQPNDPVYRSILNTVQSLQLESSFFPISKSMPLRTQEISALYRIADFLLFPSTQEGFGLPVQEAILHRVPAILSDIPPHREQPHSPLTSLFIPTSLPSSNVIQKILNFVTQAPFHSQRKYLVHHLDLHCTYKTEYISLIDQIKRS